MSLGQPRRQAGRQGSAPRYRVATRRRIPPASRPHPARLHPSRVPRPWPGGAGPAGARSWPCSWQPGPYPEEAAPGGSSLTSGQRRSRPAPTLPEPSRTSWTTTWWGRYGRAEDGRRGASRRMLRDGAPFPSREAPSPPSPSNLCPAAARGAPASIKLLVPHRSLPGSGSAPGAGPGRALSEGTGQGDPALPQGIGRGPLALVDGSGQGAFVLLGRTGQGRSRLSL